MKTEIVVKCGAPSGVRIGSPNDPNDILGSYHPDELFVRNNIIFKLHSAWWYFCRRVAEVSVEELLKADHTPIHFCMQSCEGVSDVQRHMPVNRATSAGNPNSAWEEQVWVGEFSVSLEGLAFETGISRDEASVLPVVLSFLKALDNGLVQIGGGRSIGKGVVRIENLDEVEAAIAMLPIPRGRCKRGHFASRKESSFGGKCKCKAEIRPAWTIPPEMY